MAGENYTDRANTADLNTGVGTGTVAWVVDGALNWPSTPFYARIDDGLPTMEVVRVTGVAGTNWTVTRAASGTTAATHSAGAQIQHVLPSQLPNDFEAHKGASSGVHGVSGNVVGTTDAQTLSNKTVQGTFSSTFSTAPAGTASYRSTANSLAARDGFVHDDTAADPARSAFKSTQDAATRFDVRNTGHVTVNPETPSTEGIDNAGILINDGDATFGANVDVVGNLTAENLTATTNLGVNGDSFVDGNSSTFGNALVDGALTVNGLGTIGGTLDVTGNVSTDGYLFVDKRVDVFGGNGGGNPGGPAVITVADKDNLTPFLTGADVGLWVFDGSDRYLYRWNSTSWDSMAPAGGGTTSATRYETSRGKDVVQAAASGASTLVTWPTNEYLSDYISYAAGVFTVAKAGLYAIDTTVHVVSGGTLNTRFTASINRNGSGIATNTATNTPTAVNVYSHVSTTVRLGAGDTIEVYLFQESGSNRNISTGSRVQLALLRS